MLTLTQEVIGKLCCSGTKQTIFWDYEMPCLGVRCYPGGAKAYVFRYRMLGRKHLLVIDQCWKMSIVEARAKALDMHKQTEANSDLAKERARQKELDRRLISFAEFCKIYMQLHAKPHKRSWKLDQRQIELYLLPKWKSKYLCEIKQTDVVALHKEIGAKYPYQANRVVELVSTMFRLASDWEYDVCSLKPITAYAEFERDRFLNAEELQRLSAALNEESDVYFQAIIKLLLLTGLRKSELLNLKWADVDLQSASLRIDGRVTKNGKNHREPLALHSVEILQALPVVPENPYVFPGLVSSICKNGGRLYSVDKPRNTISKAWQRVCERANLEDARIHDLRRTTGTWLAKSGNSLHMIGQILNQSNERVTQVYARLESSDVRLSLENLSITLQQKMTPATVQPVRAETTGSTEFDNVKAFVRSLHEAHRK